MLIKSPLAFLFLVIVIVCFQADVSAQGGWRQWDIIMLDGTSQYASPLQMRADGRFTRSMDPNEPGFERSKIDYLAARATALPTAPTAAVKKDLVVMLDGTRTLGTVTFKSVKFSEGTIVQNGKELSLENVAYIKFAHSKQAKPKKKV